MSTRVRPAPDECDPYYHPYIAGVPDGSVIDTLEAQVRDTRRLVDGVPAARETFRYAPGKWSVRGLLGHVVDSERIFSVRALRVARGDETPLPGFEENAYSEASNADDRSLASLMDELEAVRASTVTLLRGLPEEAWDRRGVANGRPITVRALAWITAGHERHHAGILRERYLEADR